MAEEKATVRKRAAKPPAEPVKTAKAKPASTKTTDSPSAKPRAATKATDKAPAKTAAKAPAAKKTPATSTPNSAVSKPARAPRKMVKRPAALTPDERQRMIAIAAYYRAERRGFCQGYELQDWFEAEQEIIALFGKA